MPNARQAAGCPPWRCVGMEVVPGVDRNGLLAALEPTWSDLAQRFGEERIAQIREFGA